MNEDHTKIEVTRFGKNGGTWSSEDLVVGATYRIEPRNPKKLHHRGRLCTYLGIRGGKVRVKFADTGGLGYAEVDELVLIEQPSKSGW